MEVLQAYQLAVQLHADQLDQAGQPYIHHLTRVFLRVQAAGGDRHQQIASLLHDAIEDGHASLLELERLGVAPDAVELVDILSRRDAETYMEYLARVKNSARAVLVKLADLADNTDPARLALLGEKGASLARRYAMAKAFLCDTAA